MDRRAVIAVIAVIGVVMDEKPITWDELGVVHYSASAVGGCLVALAASRQGYEKEPLPQIALDTFKAGQEAEDWYGDTYQLERRQEEIRVTITDRLQIVGHIDGVRGGTLEEVKSMSAAEWAKWTPSYWDTHPLWQRYAWQISSYMLGTMLECRVVMVNRETNHVKTYYFEKPPRTYLEIRARVFEAESLAREEVLVCEHGDYFCPFRSLHRGVEITEEPALVAVLEDYLRVKDSAKEAADQLDKLKTQIKTHLGERGKVALTSGHTVSLSEFEVKEKVIPAGRQSRLTVKGPK
jgi:hypothetical protein